MTEEEREQKISAAYRALGAEEPPRALDDAILAASRRAAGARPGLPGKADRQRWYAPLATAAILVLAVGVALNMQRESPETVSVAKLEQPAAAAAPSAALEKESVTAAAKPEAQPRAAASRAERVPQPEPGARKAPEPFAVANQDKVAADTPAAAAPPPAPAAAPAPAMAEMRASRRDAALESGSGAAGALARPEIAQMQAQRAKAAPAADSPERELERIAGLRHLGMHEEADKALAEFRKRFPDYKIPEAMRERVERR